MNVLNQLQLKFFISCLSVLILCSMPFLFAQEEQKNTIELYIGKWQGNAEIQNINMLGGWDSVSGFLGIHETIKEIFQIKFNLNFIHPLDDPLVIEECKKTGMSVDALKNIRNMSFSSLRITGFADISGFEERKHETKKYCEECKGKDGVWKKNFSEIIVPVSGEVDLTKKEVNIYFGNLPKEYNFGLSYWFSSKNVKLLGQNKIEFSYRNFEKNAVDQSLAGELYKVKVIKNNFPEKIKPNKLIKTDRKTHLEITMPSKDVIKVSQNTEVVIRSESLIEVVKGKIHNLIKKLKPKTKFYIQTPAAIAGVRGTEYVLEVEDDGTTTIIVLDGEVELSDKDNKKTVIVKKNQKSVVKTGDLPPSPEGIDPKNIFKWWE